VKADSFCLCAECALEHVFEQAVSFGWVDPAPPGGPPAGGTSFDEYIDRAADRFDHRVSSLTDWMRHLSEKLP